MSLPTLLIDVPSASRRRAHLRRRRRASRLGRVTPLEVGNMLEPARANVRNIPVPAGR
jgi:hypothetical protein